MLEICDPPTDVINSTDPIKKKTEKKKNQLHLGRLLYLRMLSESNFLLQYQYKIKHTRNGNKGNDHYR